MFAGKRLIAGFMLLLALTALLTACSSPSAPTGSNNGAGSSGVAAGNSTDGSGAGNTGAAGTNAPASQPTQAPQSGATPGNGNPGPEFPSGGGTGGTGGSIGVLPTSTGGAPAAANGNNANNSNAGGTSGTGGAEAIPASIDPCTLVTPEDIQAAVGFPVQTGRRSADQNGGTSCQFIGTQDNTNTVGITVYQGNQEVAAAQQNMGGAQAQAVPGLGDQAFFVNNGLYVRSGNNLFSVGIAAPNQQNQGQNQIMNAAVALARRIIVKLSPII